MCGVSKTVTAECLMLNYNIHALFLFDYIDECHRFSLFEHLNAFDCESLILFVSVL